MFDVRVSGQVQAEPDGRRSRAAEGEEKGLVSEARARKVAQYDHEGEATQQGASGAYIHSLCFPITSATCGTHAHVLVICAAVVLLLISYHSTDLTAVLLFVGKHLLLILR